MYKPVQLDDDSVRRDVRRAAGKYKECRLVLSVVVAKQYTHSANRRDRRATQKTRHLGAGIFATDRVEELGTA